MSQATNKYSRKIDTKMKSYGDIDDEKKIIRVNPKKGELLNTILHEEEHRRDMKANEKNIKKRALKREKSLSVNKAIHLLQMYSPKAENYLYHKKPNKNILGRV